MYNNLCFTNCYDVSTINQHTGTLGKYHIILLWTKIITLFFYFSVDSCDSIGTYIKCSYASLLSYTYGPNS